MRQHLYIKLRTYRDKISIAKEIQDKQMYINESVTTKLKIRSSFLWRLGGILLK